MPKLFLLYAILIAVPETPRCVFVDGHRLGIDDDAILFARGFYRDIFFKNIVEHHLRRALKCRAPTAPPVLSNMN